MDENMNRHEGSDYWSQTEDGWLTLEPKSSIDNTDTSVELGIYSKILRREHHGANTFIVRGSGRRCGLDQ
jgi:hypothetical protein